MGEGDHGTRDFDLIQECWEIAGVLGIDPRELTFRELSWMFHGRERMRWVHTAKLASAFSGSPAIQFIPVRYRPKVEAVPHDTTNSSIGWKLLFKGVFGQEPPSVS